jgi:hypothetical protein
LRTAHLVVVADSDHALVFAARLHCMQSGEVTTVAGLDAARRWCPAGGVDACIAAVDDAVPDARPTLQGDAPGRARRRLPTAIIATPFALARAAMPGKQTLH